MTWNYVIKDSNALQIWKAGEIVCEARSGSSAHRLVKLLNLGLQIEREAAAKRKEVQRFVSPAPERGTSVAWPLPAQPVYTTAPSPAGTFIANDEALGDRPDDCDELGPI